MIRGRVQNGVVVLETQGARRGDRGGRRAAAAGVQEGKAAKRPTVRLASVNVAGKAKHLPPDAARNLDHYLYGHAEEISALLVSAAGRRALDRRPGGSEHEIMEPMAFPWPLDEELP